jgi:hypothetical protein
MYMTVFCMFAFEVQKFGFDLPFSYSSLEILFVKSSTVTAGSSIVMYIFSIKHLGHFCFTG